MKLVMIDCVPGGRPGAILASGEILHLERVTLDGTAESWLPPSLKEILHAGREGLDLVRRIVNRVEDLSSLRRTALQEQGALLPSSTRLLAPIVNPSLFVSAGHAYRSHVNEMKSQAPKTPQGFLKAPGIIVGPRADVRLPPQCPEQVDFEGEICAVIGRTCHNLRPDEAMDCVAGYTLTNDVSARDWVPEIAKAKSMAEVRAAWDLNHLGKQLPAFAPLGPALVTSDEVDPGRFELTTRLNREVMQSANTADLIFTVAETVAFFSRWYEFQPGDIISTGTPAGVGFSRNPQVFLRAGDIVEVEATGLGKISNRFVTA